MSKIHFKPWVGKNYKKQNVKLLILGESHHAEDPNQSASFTIDLMHGISKDEWTHAYWTNILQAITGQKKWEVDIERFWSNIFFSFDLILRTYLLSAYATVRQRFPAACQSCFLTCFY